MKSVHKSTRGDIAAAHDDLRRNAKAIREIEERLAAAVETALVIHGELEGAIDGYNEAVEAINDRYVEVLADIEAYVEQRTERWQEGDAGQRYSEWRDAIENAKIETIDVPDAPQFEALDLADEPEIPPLSLDDV